MVTGACSVNVEEVKVKLGGVEVLKRINLHVEPGSLVCVIGPNGAGKTTLLRVLAGIIRPSEGVVRVCNGDPQSPYIKKRVTYIPSHPEVDPRLTGIDVALLHRYGLSEASLLWGSKDLENARKAFGALRAERLIDARWGWMSGGERRLTLLAGALSRASGLILADEPFSNLDLANQKLIASILASMKRTSTIIYTAHNPLHTVIADIVILLDGGSVIAIGRPEDVLRESLLERIYGVRVEVVEVGGVRVPVPIIAP
ncbi:MAG: ABC transporter ATP-binding protein [Desulfurococcales archaeon]|nr:ABC transporter ATP-binding protein [Desulfurococcales archaeon]